MQACYLLILVLVRPLTWTALSTFLLASADVHYSPGNQASGLQLRALPVGLPFPQELDLYLNDSVHACISPWLFLYPLCMMFTKVISDNNALETHEIQTSFTSSGVYYVDA